jgi:hypothetical protein
MPRSSRRRIRLVTVIGGLRPCRARLGRPDLRRFSTSNGCQNHTVLPYAATSANSRSAMCCRPHLSEGVEAPFVHASVDRSQVLACPAIPARDDAAASTASHPNVRDDRDTSLSRDGMARDKPVIWVRRKSKYFCEWGWTARSPVWLQLDRCG